MFLGSAGDRTIFQILTRRGIDISPFSAVRRAALSFGGVHTAV
jgi:hypothetical protein